MEKWRFRKKMSLSHMMERVKGKAGFGISNLEAGVCTQGVVLELLSGFILLTTCKEVYLDSMVSFRQQCKRFELIPGLNILSRD